MYGISVICGCCSICGGSDNKPCSTSCTFLSSAEAAAAAEAEAEVVVVVAEVEVEGKVEVVDVVDNIVGSSLVDKVGICESLSARGLFKIIVDDREIGTNSVEWRCCWCCHEKRGCGCNATGVEPDRRRNDTSPLDCGC